VSLPVFAIAGAEFVNFWNDNTLMLIYVLLVCTILVLVVSTDLVPSRLFPLAIFSISLSLVLHQALISQHIWGSDINIEYYYYQVTLQSRHWNTTINPPDSSTTVMGYAATTSVTVFPAMLTLISDIAGTWVFKAIFPALYALVPLVLYPFLQKQIGARSAFLAVFFFMAIPSFYEVDLSLGKQMIATLFLTMFVFSLLRAPKRHRMPISLLLAIGVIISHYSLGLFLLSLLVFITPILWLKHRSYELPITLTLSLAAFYIFWYNMNTHGFIIDMFVSYANSIYLGLNQFLNLGSRYSIALITQTTLTPADQVIKFLNLIYQGLIVLGLFSYWHSRDSRKWTFAEGYDVISIICFTFLVMAVILPYFGSYFDVTRLYSVSLLFLTPFGVLGGLVFGRWVTKALKSRYNQVSWLRYLSIFATIFLLFNIGFVSAVAHESYPSAFSLITKTPYSVYNQGEFNGGLWLVTHTESQAVVFMDPNSAPLFLSAAYLNNLDIPWPLQNSTNIMLTGSILFLNTWNLQTNKIQLATQLAGSNELTTMSANLTQRYAGFLIRSDRVFDNALSTTLWLP
jgi:uncharacterized membrane protein